MVDTLTGYVDAWARHTPDAIVLSEAGTELGYAALQRRIDQDAGRLRALGVARGDRVALAGVNTIDWVCAFLGALRLGAVIVPLNSRLGAGQIRPLLDLLEPAVVLADDTQEPLLESLPPGTVPVYRISGSGDMAGRFAHVRPEPLPPPDIRPEDPALLAFTSGTTGAPKAAIISHGSLLASARSFRPHLRLTAASRTTVLVPLFHNTGYVDQLAHMIVVGGQVDLVRRFGRSDAITAMTRRPPDYLAMVPSILRMLMLTPEADTVFRDCTVIVLGGAALPAAWSAEMRARWPEIRILSGYGLTEFTSGSHVLPAEMLGAHPDAVGYPLDGVGCTVRAVDGTPCRPGEPGEVWLRGPMRMTGYWRRPDATAAALSGEWLRTGDLGTVDADGLLRLHGRINQVINRGGEKILPGELEDLLSASDAVAEVAVVGLPDPLLGERVAAAVVLKSGRRLDTGPLLRLLDGNVPDYAIPETVVAVDELPRNPTGKVDRAGTAELLRHRADLSTT
ncbi:acyl--CoA ligase [Pseudonocardia sp. C8]|uniref:class I adenylate-forming enzyme family protein n=1 Tax=Pseudonocardia sp. C8 TaxID=2762759 RepID=UPI001642FE67|nr:class I adenylate-forming enzyme family protein [Pseudonocardia sp. C8]MBC3190999.1 acyl--CoA ligase [Pseudonocardia sp. C8]